MVKSNNDIFKKLPQTEKSQLGAILPRSEPREEKELFIMRNY